MEVEARLFCTFSGVDPSCGGIPLSDCVSGNTVQYGLVAVGMFLAAYHGIISGLPGGFGGGLGRYARDNPTYFTDQKKNYLHMLDALNTFLNKA